MRPFGGIDFFEVESGTEFEDPATGEKHVVTDDSVVFKGHRAYVTPTMLERICKHPDIMDRSREDKA